MPSPLRRTSSPWEQEEHLRKREAVSPTVHVRRSPFLGVDRCPLTGRAFVNRGSLIATVVVPPVAGTALEAVLKAIATKTKPPDLHLIPSYSYPALESLRPIAAAAHR